METDIEKERRKETEWETGRETDIKKDRREETEWEKGN